jgi:hypothetical protein
MMRMNKSEMNAEQYFELTVEELKNSPPRICNKSIHQTRMSFQASCWRILQRDATGSGYTIEFQRTCDGGCTWSKAEPPQDIRQLLERKFFAC